MDLQDVYKIKETANIEVFNRLTDQKWVLIDKYTTAQYPLEAPNALTMKYVLGITKENFKNYDDSEIKNLEDPYSSYEVLK